MEWQPVSERIIVARFKASFGNVTFVQSYAPTDDVPPDAKQVFFDQLTSIMNNVHKKDIVIQLGDMNAQISSDKRELESVIRKQALGTMTDNGEICTHFRQEHELVFTEYQIDHISISRRFKSSLLDVRNKRSADITSDHHLLIEVLRISISRVKSRSERVTRRYNVKKLQNPAFVAELRSNLAMIQQTHADIDGQWSHIDQEIATGRWLQKEKEVKKLCKRNKQWWINDLATEAEEAERMNLRKTFTYGIFSQGQDWQAVARVQRISLNAPTIDEIEKTIRSMKINKSPGIDQIITEMLKSDSILSTQTLQRLAVSERLASSHITADGDARGHGTSHQEGAVCICPTQQHLALEPPQPENEAACV
ncbi:hypothetical protein ILUMI_06963 [Ignelater luminosus]|uniref:Uncharacterized protein n=1 Tax=Ignelater luminosus TaxID=2038154 RepID=A0A8K0D979_IGNLU|nr:hypothetical protein ILUMI_06963 [Ignelater luminosus]